MEKILYTSKEVLSKIKGIFGSPKPKEKRVAIVAYLGEEADTYLPSPQNLHIICNPEPGATSPAAIRRLLERGATIQFSDSLHMKVYWSNLRGCVITSANASYRALGGGNLKESGVFLPKGTVDIKQGSYRVLGSFQVC